VRPRGLGAGRLGPRCRNDQAPWLGSTYWLAHPPTAILPEQSLRPCQARDHAANLAVGIVALLLAAAIDGPLLWTIAIVNLLFAAIAMAPLPTMDGGVIWLNRP
jgi:hypothetical protein